MPIQRIFLIGAGVIGHAHAKSARAIFEDTQESWELHVCDRDRAALKKFKNEYPEATTWTDVGEMLASDPVETDVVIVATPPPGHHPLSLLALRGGRHVLCEKPLAMNAEEAGEMLAVARKNDRLLGCCSSRFLGKERDDLREILSGMDIYAGLWMDLRPRGRSGVEYQPQTPWFVQGSHSGGGCLMDWAPYDFSTLHHLLNPREVLITEAFVHAPDIAAASLPDDITPDVETHAGATLRYRLTDGREVLLNYERAAAFHGDSFCRQVLFGKNGGIELNHIGDQPAKIFWDEGGQQVQEEVPDIDLDILGAHDRPLRHFFQRIKQGSGPAVVQDQAVFNFLVIQGIYQAAETGRGVRIVKAEQPRLELLDH